MDVWEARRIRFARITSAMRPSRASRVAGVAHRLTRPDCVKCGGADYIHLASCPRARRALATGSTRIQFGNAVVAVVERRRVRRELHNLMHALGAPCVTCRVMP